MSQSIELLKEEISFIDNCPDDCSVIDVHAHKAGLQQLLFILQCHASKIAEAVKLLEDARKIIGSDCYKLTEICDADENVVKALALLKAEKPIDETDKERSQALNNGQALKLFRLNVLNMGILKFAAWLGILPSELCNIEQGRDFDDTPKIEKTVCEKCNGTGEVYISKENGAREVGYSESCPSCKGTGVVLGQNFTGGRQSPISSCSDCQPETESPEVCPSYDSKNSTCMNPYRKHTLINHLELQLKTNEILRQEKRIEQLKDIADLSYDIHTRDPANVKHKWGVCLAEAEELLCDKIEQVRGLK
jgi:hypothetical protein